MYVPASRIGLQSGKWFVIETPLSRLIVESTEETEKLKKTLKEEKQAKKRLESKVDHIEEELNDLKHEKESLEKVRTWNRSDTRVIPFIILTYK